MLAVGVHGYHPYAEDGGLYLPEIRRLLDPSLYPHETEFVMGHLRLSLFAPMVAGLVRGSRLSVEMALLLLHVASFWATLYAAWLLAARCFGSREARCGAVALLATWMTLPIAGTSLMLMDSYVTARSISTPCVLLALVGMVEFMLPRDSRRWRALALCVAALAMAAVMHPLMAAYGFGCVLVLGCVLSSDRWLRVSGSAWLWGTAVFVAGVVQWMGPGESAAYQRVAMTRDYWFLSQWHWYEWIGLIAPLIILSAVAFGRRREGGEARVALARMAVMCGTAAGVVAMLFARVSLASHLVARLQPLRIFQTVYVVMILVVGAALAERVLKRQPMRWAVTFVLLGGIMLFAERQTFPDSAHLELPGRVSQNSWEQAFVWISKNTPKNAVFALDSNYITRPDEDAQCFRAIAGRSALPDYTKDGGEAANAPALTRAWTVAQAAQSGLSAETDALRVAALRPLRVTWVVLDRSAVTAFACGYANDAVKVCRLP